MALSKIKGTVIADDAINADRIADGTVVASDLLDNTITGAKLATDIAISTTGATALNGTIKLDGNYPTGTENVALGNQALDGGSLSGGYNVAIGSQSMSANTTGCFNTAVGTKALLVNANGTRNVAIGFDAMCSNTAGDRNVAVGNNVMALNQDGEYNVAIGFSSLVQNVNASNNTAVGYQSLCSNTTGAQNVAFGSTSLCSNTTGITNTAIGGQSLLSNTTASNSVAMGYQALRDNTTGANNTAIGYQALRDNTTSADNTALGNGALIINTGTQNTALGRIAGSSITSGSNLTTIGYNAQPSSATATNEITLGDANVTDLRVPGANFYIDDGNVAIGTATPNAITGYGALTIAGTVSTGGFLDFEHGSTLNSSIVGSPSGLNILTRIDQPIIFKVNTTEGMRLTSTGLGIGISSPQAPLHIVGTSSLSTEFKIGNASWNQSTSNSGLLHQYRGSDGYSELQINSVTTSPTSAFTVRNSTGIAMNFTNDGASTFNGKLTVNDTIKANDISNRTSVQGVDATPNDANTFELGAGYLNLYRDSDAEVNQIQFGKSGNLAAAFSTGADYLAIKTNGDNERMRITSAGKVLVNTTGEYSGTPAEMTINDGLDIGTTSSTNGGFVQFIGDGVGKIGEVGSKVSGYSTMPNIEFHADNVSGGSQAGHIEFNTKFNSGSRSEAFRISSNGDLMQGGTSRVSSEGVGLYIENAGGNDGAIIELKHTRNAGSSRDFLRFFNNSDGEAGAIVHSGETSVTYATSSDYRLKENVNYNFDATTRLKQLKPARFNFISEPEKTVDGFIAHEVSSIVPEAVTGEKDAINAKGKPSYQGIDQSKLVPLLVKTIQELEARITALEANNP